MSSPPHDSALEVSDLPPRGVRRVRVAVVIALAVALGVLWWTGALAELADPDYIRGIVRDAGPVAPLVFVLLQIPLNLLFLGGVPAWLSATLWPLPWAILYSWVGTVAASTGTYVLGRYAGTRWLGMRIPRRLQRLERRFDRAPVRTVATWRMLLWINPGVDLLMAAARVPMRSYLVGTALGLALPTGLRVAVGDVGIDALTDVLSGKEEPAWSWLIGIAAALGVLALLRLRRGNRPGVASAQLLADAREEP